MPNVTEPESSEIEPHDSSIDRVVEHEDADDGQEQVHVAQLKGQDLLGSGDRGGWVRSRV